MRKASILEWRKTKLIDLVFVPRFLSNFISTKQRVVKHLQLLLNCFSSYSKAFVLQSKAHCSGSRIELYVILYSIPTPALPTSLEQILTRVAYEFFMWNMRGKRPACGKFIALSEMKIRENKSIPRLLSRRDSNWFWPVCGNCAIRISAHIKTDGKAWAGKIMEDFMTHVYVSLSIKIGIEFNVVWGKNRNQKKLSARFILWKLNLRDSNWQAREERKGKSINQNVH